MNAPFAIYVRVSEVGDREGPSFGSPAEQEAAARAWAEREAVDVYFDVDECVELDVSGATKADDRKLGRLIARCEAGELGGVIVRFEDRFARDVIEGATALRRLEDAGARLVASASGFDSEHITPDKRAWFNTQMAFAQAQRERNRESRMRGSQRAAERGLYLASRPPLGYAWADRQRGGKHGKDGEGIGKIVPDPETAPLVQELFRRRAEGDSLRLLALRVREAGHRYTKSGIRALIANRAYLGEMTIPTARKGATKTVTGAHQPLVTVDEWERANAVGGTYAPRTGRWAAQARLAGLPRCSGCGGRLSPTGGGAKRDVAYYTCNAEICTGRVGIRMERLDSYVENLLEHAVLVREPHVVAILAGDDRYQRALDAVEAARTELETFIETVQVTDIGKDSWIRGKTARQEALDLARRALRDVPPVREAYTGKLPAEVSVAGIEAAMARDTNARFIDRIVVKPVGRGRRVPVAERTEIYFIGSETPAAPLPEPVPLEVAA
jgi:site-specific DNA recombinase